MRSKVLWFLLTASLALNVFFVAGVIWPRLMGHPYPPHGRDPVAAAAEQFKLDDRQVAALEALRQRLAERRSESRGQRDGFQRSEESRVGKTWVSTWRSRRFPYHQTKKTYSKRNQRTNR